jgi:hypothetical protein
MPSNRSKVKIVRVRIEQGREGLFYATSPDLRGLLVAKPDLESLYQSIPQAIKELYAVCGVEAVVMQAESDTTEYRPWVAIPTEMTAEVSEQEKRN